MASENPNPARAAGISAERTHLRHNTSVIRQIIHRLLLLALLGLLWAPAAPPAPGAIQPLWAEAADLYRLKSYAAAVEVYEQIAALTPQDPEPLLFIGDIYLAQRRWPLAEDAFNRALARAGENARAQAGLATARWEQGDHQRAVRLWEAMLASQPADQPAPPDIRVRLALAYMHLGRLSDAAAMLNQELARSDNAAARLYLAILQAPEDPAGARQALAAITDEVPPSLLATRAYLLAALDQAETAGSAAGAAKALGMAFVQLKVWPLAQAALERALALAPGDAEALAFLGHTRAQLGQPAFADLTAAVASQPDWPLGHYLLGLYYLKQAAYGFAVEEFQVTLRLDPGNSQAQVDLARAYLGLGQYLAAEEALKGAVESAPGDLAFRRELVRFYAAHAVQVTGRGLDAARAAADLAPEDPQLREMLGWMYFMAGDTAMARLHLESALRLNPELASAHYHLGMLRQAFGEEEAARFAFLRAIDLDTDGFYRSQAQTALREITQTGQ